MIATLSFIFLDPVTTTDLVVAFIEIMSARYPNFNGKSSLLYASKLVHAAKVFMRFFQDDNYRTEIACCSSYIYGFTNVFGNLRIFFLKPFILFSFYNYDYWGIEFFFVFFPYLYHFLFLYLFIR